MRNPSSYADMVLCSVLAVDDSMPYAKEMPAILDLRFCKEQKLLKHSIIESSSSKGSSGFLFLL